MFCLYSYYIVKFCSSRTIIGTLKSANDITENFFQVQDISGVKFWCYHAGHVLGACMFMIEIAGVRVRTRNSTSCLMHPNSFLTFNKIGTTNRQSLSCVG